MTQSGNMAKLGALHTLLQHVAHPLKQQQKDLLPQHQTPGEPTPPLQEGEADGQMFTRSFYHSGGNHPYDDDNDKCSRLDKSCTCTAL